MGSIKDIEQELIYWQNKYQQSCEDTHVADEMVYKLKRELEAVKKDKEV